jgi:hypothetical protein
MLRGLFTVTFLWAKDLENKIWWYWRSHWSISAADMFDQSEIRSLFKTAQGGSYSKVYMVITNYVSNYINLLVRISHVICNHPVFVYELEKQYT